MLKNFLLLFWVLFCFIVLYLVMVWVAITGFGKQTEDSLIDAFIKGVLFKIVNDN